MYKCAKPNRMALFVTAAHTPNPRCEWDGCNFLGIRTNAVHSQGLCHNVSVLWLFSDVPKKYQSSALVNVDSY